VKPFSAFYSFPCPVPPAVAQRAMAAKLKPTEPEASGLQTLKEAMRRGESWGGRCGSPLLCDGADVGTVPPRLATRRTHSHRFGTHVHNQPPPAPPLNDQHHDRAGRPDRDGGQGAKAHGPRRPMRTHAPHTDTDL